MTKIYDGASTEPLEIIRSNECEAAPESLVTKRFRALWNEIERLRGSVAMGDMEALVEALNRQGDNMAFIINHATLPDQWMDKFSRELAEDRAALTAALAQQPLSVPEQDVKETSE